MIGETGTKGWLSNPILPKSPLVGGNAEKGTIIDGGFAGRIHSFYCSAAPTIHVAVLLPSVLLYL